MSRESESPALPRLLLIADRFTDPARAAVIERVVVEGMVPWLQLRDHAARHALFRGRGDCLVQRLRAARQDLRVSVNTDVELARNLETGIHLGYRGSSVAEVRRDLGSEALIGYSAHDLDSAVQAVDEGVDYVTLSPVYPTSSKPGQPALGAAALAEICKAVCTVPVFALGGITPGRVEECLEAGAYGAAVLSGILCADDPVQASANYLARL